MSEEDEIIRKEREILEILELEERRNYENDSKNNYGDLGKFFSTLVFTFELICKKTLFKKIIIDII